MFGTVPTIRRSLNDYVPIAGAEAIDELRRQASPLRGARVTHLTAAAFGAGTPEEVGGLVPLLREAGMVSDWQVMRSADEFQRAARVLRGALSGQDGGWSPQLADTWLRYNQVNADLWEGRHDFVVLHDAEAAGVLLLLEERLGGPPRGRWSWRCRLDMSSAAADAIDFLQHYLQPYAATIWADPAHVPAQAPAVRLVGPAIDPLGSRNLDLSDEAARAILSSRGIAWERPLVCQAGPLDGSTGAIEAIEVYRLMKAEVPHLQLLLVGRIGLEAVSGPSYYDRCLQHSDGDPDIHFLVDAGGIEVNACQRAARVALQLAEAGADGLAVCEASWKGRPVVVGPQMSQPRQLVDGVTGFVTHSTEEAASRILELIRNPDLAEEVGRRGRAYVRERFLLTRALSDYLELFLSL